MKSRERILGIMDLNNTDRTGFWLGSPVDETVKIYGQQLGLDTREEVEDHFDSDCYFVCADLCNSWKHPEGKSAIWGLCGIDDKKSHGQAGPFAEFTLISEVEKIEWPDPDYLDYTEALVELKRQRYQGKAVLSGSWSHFFHVVSDLFGMDQYFIKMHTDPQIVEAVTDRVVDFFVKANEKYFEHCGDYFDVFFFGNDFGSQRDLLISPDFFRKFVLPGLKKIIEVAKRYNKPVMLHSCGAIARVIPWLIDAGVDAIHPLQARAAGMDAKSFARQFKGKIAFAGGVDTQDILVNATPDQVKEEVKRLKKIFGPHYIVSPSHESLLPNVPLVNVEAMAAAARE